MKLCCYRFVQGVALTQTARRLSMKRQRLLTHQLRTNWQPHLSSKTEVGMDHAQAIPTFRGANPRGTKKNISGHTLKTLCIMQNEFLPRFAIQSASFVIGVFHSLRTAALETSAHTIMQLACMNVRYSWTYHVNFYRSENSTRARRTRQAQS